LSSWNAVESLRRHSVPLHILEVKSPHRTINGPWTTYLIAAAITVYSD
jgi:hypothetical protein